MATTRKTTPDEHAGRRFERVLSAVLRRPDGHATWGLRRPTAVLSACAFALGSATAAGEASQEPPSTRKTTATPAPTATRSDSPRSSQADAALPKADVILVAQASPYPLPGATPGSTSAYFPGIPSTSTFPGSTVPSQQPENRPAPLTASLLVQETLTNNVNLRPTDERQSDLVSQITPQFNLDLRGAHSRLSGYLSAPALLYVRTGYENNHVYPSIGVLGDLEALNRFFFVEGQITVAQEYFTPFGAQPPDLANVTNNRYTSAVYRVSPFIQGTGSTGIQYLVRNNNVWTNLSGAPIATSNAYYDQWLGRVASPVNPLGWGADYEWDSVKFKDQGPLITQIARGRVVAQADPQLQLWGIGGYEDNHYTFTDYRGPVYGGGIRWTPTPRANLVANWEHRFFGSSYYVAFQNRGPLSGIDVRISRNITSYPQQFLSIPATGDVPLLLDAIFASRIPDPVARQTFINTLIQDRGLPTSLTSAVNLYNQQISLVEDGRVILAALGAKNSIFLTAQYVKSEPITAAGTPLPGLLGNNNTQKLVSLTWTHNLAPLVTLGLTASGVRTTLNQAPYGTTTQGYVTLKLAALVSSTTTAFAGARYQKSNSDFGTNYNEAAIFAGLLLLFR